MEPPFRFSFLSLFALPLLLTPDSLPFFPFFLHLLAFHPLSGLSLPSAASLSTSLTSFFSSGGGGEGKLSSRSVGKPSGFSLSFLSKGRAVLRSLGVSFFSLCFRVCCVYVLPLILSSPLISSLLLSSPLLSLRPNLHIFTPPHPSTRSCNNL